MIDPSGRVQIVDGPTQAPGVCVLCGKPNDNNPFVYFGMDEDFYGAFYFCTECLQEVAAAVDCVPVAKLEESQEKLKSMAQELKYERLRNDELDNSLSGFRDLLNTLHNGVDNAELASEATKANSSD